MPKILEMKVDGPDLWVRVENIAGEKSPIHLWTNEEAERFRLRARQDLLEEIKEKIIP